MTKSSRRSVGSVRELPNGKWEAAVAVGRRANGKIRRMTKRLASKADAERWIRETSIELGARPDLSAGVTLSWWWEAYKKGKGARLVKGTIRAYTSLMNLVWIPAMGDQDISTITCAQIQDVLLGLPRSKAEHARSVLSSVLTDAVNEGVLKENVMRGTRFELAGDTGTAWEDESVWDGDPFAVIEAGRDVWDASTVMRAMPLMRGLRLEPVWLAMVGAGLRMQEAFALRKCDVRRRAIMSDGDGRPIVVTQLAVHHAESLDDGRKRTKTSRSVRIASMMEPFGMRYWELAQMRDEPTDPVCDVPRSNAGRMWRGYFERTDPETAKHRPKDAKYAGDRGCLVDKDLRYVPLSKMRSTHESLMQEAGILDSINAAMHGHSRQVAYEHYQRADTAAATAQASARLRLVANG